LIRLLPPWPALLAELDERILLVADLHIGFEYELSKLGISIPYQTDRMLEDLIKLVKDVKPDRLIVLGDVKHGVPITSFQEKRELPLFFVKLLEEVPRIDVTRGNHDGNLPDIVPSEVTIHTSKGVILGEDFKVAILHGHAWPKAKMLEANLIVTGHNHPTVQLKTPLGIRLTQRAWIKGVLEPVKLAKAFLEQHGVKYEGYPVKAMQKQFETDLHDPEMIVMPTFNDLLGGLPVNGETPQSLLGPLFRREAVNVEEFDVILLDGTYLGKVGFLRERDR
jgi:hypothetical protein